ncbi:MAG: hypothetical protein H6636_06860 [Anaerolineales bacterium]|nr:hypothetical protein [Anaerolineales bacterium]
MKNFLPKIILILLIFIMTLAACLPSDPYTLRAAADTLIEGTHVAQTETAEAAVRANQEAVLQQMQTQQSSDNLSTATANVVFLDATSTALALDARATQQAATQIAEATQAAQIAEATRSAVELAQLQAGATATQAAESRIAEAETAKLAREKVITFLLWLAVFILSGVAIYLAFRLGEMFIATSARQRSWIPGAETFAWQTTQGLSLVQPRKMVSPALHLNQHTGQATMPQLTPPDAQLYTTLAALAVELQREVSKRAQWFTPQGGSFVPMPEQSPAAQLPAPPALEPLPMLEKYHILIAGSTGSGKTHTGRYLLQGRQNAIVLDPHDDGSTWPEHCQVVGGGRDFETIAMRVGQMVALMDERYHLRETGAHSFPPVTLAVDEIPAIVDHEPSIARQLMQIGMEGRKVGVFLVLLSQSVLVRSLRIEGQGDLRENFATVRLSPLPAGATENTPRTATVIIGNLNKPQSESQFLVPQLGPGQTHPQARFDLTSLPAPVPSTAEQAIAEAARIRTLHAQGLSLNEIQRQVFGYSGGNAYEITKTVIEGSTTTN